MNAIMNMLLLGFIATSIFQGIFAMAILGAIYDLEKKIDQNTPKTP